MGLFHFIKNIFKHKKSSAIGLILVSVIAATGMSKKRAASVEAVATPSPTASATPQPSSPPSTKIITLKCDKSCNPTELAEAPKIEALMNSVIMSDCFSNYFKGLKSIDMAQGYTGAQIVAILRKPSNLTLNYYNYSDTTVDGYEQDPDYSTIHFNRTAMKANGFTTCDKASLGGHEMSHSKGFFHNGNSADKNWNTVPYNVNHAFDSEDDFGTYQPNFGHCCK